MTDSAPIFRPMPDPPRRFVRSDDGPETAVLLNGRLVRGKSEDGGWKIEDGKDDPSSILYPPSSFSTFLADRVTCPDLAGQLRSTDKIDTVICSLLDTDPSVPLNVTAAAAFPDDMHEGVRRLTELTGATRIRIAADPAKAADWFGGVRQKTRPPGMKVVPLRGDYPQTDPTLMLYSILDRRLKPGVSPTTQGVLLVDAVAAIEVGRGGRAAINSTDSPRALLAVRDHLSGTTHYVDAPVGCRLADVCNFLDIEMSDPVVRGGDFLRDCFVPADAVVGGGESVVHLSARQLAPNPDPCIRCGWCVEACPTRCHPAGLLAAAQSDDRRAAARHGLSACIECGICDYVCPTRLPLLAAIRSLKVDRTAAVSDKEVSRARSVLAE